MAIGFIIMQIGNEDMDVVCEEAIVPAIEACGLEAKRVDKHNEGRLLNSEIARFITEADIVVADLTNERQNCYLEVGYAMGLGKFNRLVLAAREDHFHESDNYKPRGPKIHFDLGGYDILRWERKDLMRYRRDLEKQIKRRLNSAAKDEPNDASQGQQTSEWYLKHIAHAREASINSGRNGGFEVFGAIDKNRELTLQELRSACQDAPINKHGLGMGMYWSAPEAARPKPMSDGIVAEIKIADGYSYWGLSKAGNFYQEISFLEDSLKEQSFFIDFHIMRVTEALLYLDKLYTTLKYKQTDFIRVTVRNWGLKGRNLSSGSSLSAFTLLERTSAETDSEASLIVPLEDVEPNLYAHVKTLCDVTFHLFGFYQPDNVLYERTIAKFRQQLGV